MENGQKHASPHDGARYAEKGRYGQVKIMSTECACDVEIVRME